VPADAPQTTRPSEGALPAASRRSRDITHNLGGCGSDGGNGSSPSYREVTHELAESALLAELRHDHRCVVPTLPLQEPVVIADDNHVSVLGEGQEEDIVNDHPRPEGYLNGAWEKLVNLEQGNRGRCDGYRTRDPLIPTIHIAEVSPSVFASLWARD
jgi:hypothetical protein